VVQRVTDQVAGDRVGGAQVVQRLVGQHHAPAEGVEGLLRSTTTTRARWVLQLHQQAEIQAGWAAANA
jgi:hypothetical protein